MNDIRTSMTGALCFLASLWIVCQGLSFAGVSEPSSLVGFLLVVAVAAFGFYVAIKIERWLGGI